MPNLNTIATNINDALLATPFVNNKFKPASFLGIAEFVKTTESEKDFFEPAIVDNDGECTRCAFDDTNAIQAYHRIQSLVYRDDPEGYGDDKTMEETADMRFVFFGQRNKITARKEDVVAAIQMHFIKEFSSADLTTLDLASCIIEMGDVNLDQYSVWDEEFKGIDFGLAPEVMLFSISYKVISTYNKTCFTLCA